MGLVTGEADVSASDASGALENSAAKEIWGFPKIRGTILGIPIIRTVVSWGLPLGPLILGIYPLALRGLGLRVVEGLTRGFREFSYQEKMGYRNGDKGFWRKRILVQPPVV